MGSDAGQERWRERKRRETLGRITEAALRLFIADGYDATTLDAIAQASGISRRTFFYYFESKEEILLAWQAGLPQAVRDAVLAQSNAPSPLDAARSALMALAREFSSDQALAIDRILRSTEQLRASNLAKYIKVEEAAFEALCELWPDPKLQPSHRMVAMASIGALRVAIDAWAEEGGGPLAGHVAAAFANLSLGLAAPSDGDGGPRP